MSAHERTRCVAAHLALSVLLAALAAAQDEPPVPADGERRPVHLLRIAPAAEQDAAFRLEMCITHVITGQRTSKDTEQVGLLIMRRCRSAEAGQFRMQESIQRFRRIHGTNEYDSDCAADGAPRNEHAARILGGSVGYDLDGRGQVRGRALRGHRGDRSVRGHGDRRGEADSAALVARTG